MNKDSVVVLTKIIHPIPPSLLVFFNHAGCSHGDLVCAAKTKCFSFLHVYTLGKIQQALYFFMVIPEKG